MSKINVFEALDVSRKLYAYNFQVPAEYAHKTQEIKETIERIINGPVVHSVSNIGLMNIGPTSNRIGGTSNSNSYYDLQGRREEIDRLKFLLEEIFMELTVVHLISSGYSYKQASKKASKLWAKYAKRKKL